MMSRNRVEGSGWHSLLVGVVEVGREKGEMVSRNRAEGSGWHSQLVGVAEVGGEKGGIVSRTVSRDQLRIVFDTGASNIPE